MFCLFRNSKIEPHLNLYVTLLSLAGVIAWLYFSFIEKSLVGKVLGGEALIVDLLFGLPLVLMLAVVVYACIYWSCKLLIIFLLPQAIISLSDESAVLQDALENESIEKQEDSHGKEYWNKTPLDTELNADNKPEDPESLQSNTKALNKSEVDK